MVKTKIKALNNKKNASQKMYKIVAEARRERFSKLRSS